MTTICTKIAVAAIAMFAAPLAAQTTNCMSLGGGFVTCNTTGANNQQNNAAVLGMFQSFGAQQQALMARDAEMRLQRQRDEMNAYYAIKNSEAQRQWEANRAARKAPF